MIKKFFKWVAICFVGFVVLMAVIVNMSPSAGKAIEKSQMAVLESTPAPKTAPAVTDNTKAIKAIKDEVDLTFKTSDWYRHIKDIKIEGGSVNVYTNLNAKPSNAVTATRMANAIMTACTGKTTGNVRVLASDGARIGDMVEILK